MIKTTAFALGLFLFGCGMLTPKTESDLEKMGAAILCVIEHVEIDDPDLNKGCDGILGQLTTAQRAAVMRTARDRADVRAFTSTARCAKDGGT